MEIRVFYKIKCFAIIVLALFLGSCTKFLDEKNTASLMIPRTYEDLIALMDANGSINHGMTPGLIEAGTDDYYLLPTVANSLQDFERDNYFWRAEPRYTSAATNLQWKKPYASVFVSNTVLDYVDRIKENNTFKYNTVKGQALFLKAYAYLQLAQVFMAPYNLDRENEELGLPLRMTGDVSEATKRSTMKETYLHIIGCFKEAAALLPTWNESSMRASRPAAHAALSRTYLIMGRYDEAVAEAEKALKDYSRILDYASCDSNATLPFRIMNEETLFFATCSGLSTLNPTRANINIDLVDSYGSNDFRKKLFFTKRANGTYSFKGSYTGFNIQNTFAGITVPELYLILAECYARRGELESSRTALNKLLMKRYKPGFVLRDFSSKEALLDYILLERRKEMILRSVRWWDLRRLNQEPRYAKELKREELVGNGVIEHVLRVADYRYVYLLPQEIVQSTGIPQNMRD